jgi:hypothetical protein
VYDGVKQDDGKEDKDLITCKRVGQPRTMRGLRNFAPGLKIVYCRRSGQLSMNGAPQYIDAFGMREDIERIMEIILFMNCIFRTLVRGSVKVLLCICT